MDGLIASPLDARAVRSLAGPGKIIVTPGVRSAGAAKGDQKRVATPADAIRDGMGRSVVRNLKTMARMGVFLERAVHQRYPEFPVRSGVHSWEEYLPPLSSNLEQLVETYEGAAAATAAR